MNNYKQASTGKIEQVNVSEFLCLLPEVSISFDVYVYASIYVLCVYVYVYVYHMYIMMYIVCMYILGVSCCHI